MKKLIALAAVVAIHAAPVAAMERPVIKQSPMVLVELEASMKADLIHAERKMGWEIRDELVAQTAVLLQEQLVNTSIATLTTEITPDWNNQSED